MAEELIWYYTNARLGGKTALLAGPFMEVDRAEHYIDVCGPLFVAMEPRAVDATFGVMSAKKFAGYGLFNKELRAAGDLAVPVPEN